MSKVFKDVGGKVQFTEFTRTSVSLTLIAGGSHHELRFQSTGKLFFPASGSLLTTKAGTIRQIVEECSCLCSLHGSND